MSSVWRILEFWVAAAALFGLAAAIGSAGWRPYTGHRTPFGEVFSHWDFKGGFTLAFLSPILGPVYLWRRLFRRVNRSNGHSSQTITKTATPRFTSHITTHSPEALHGESPLCPRCGYVMRRKSGRFGDFWGCIYYPRCKGTKNIDVV